MDRNICIEHGFGRDFRKDVIYYYCDKSRRKYRGLFQAQTKLINADVNGSYQIIMKVFPNAFGYGIEGCRLDPVIISAT